MRLLAIDPGEKMIGVAVSDPSGTIARPLTTLRHEARAKDAERIVRLAVENDAEGIVLGLALDAEGRIGPQARHAERLTDAIRALTSLPVIPHDESGSSQFAQAAMLATGKSRRARHEQIHAVAAAAILQSYLDAHPSTPPTAETPR
jgi:putative Holliday junction resolvase